MFDFPLDGSYNARGIGAVNRPWLVRTAALDGLTSAGEAALRKLGVDLIIDLREPGERQLPGHGLTVRSLPLYGEQPPAHGALEGVYLGLLAERGAAITRAVVAIATHPGVAAVHCTAGKDRTGLVVALARLAAGDARTEVVADYARSGRVVRSARREIATAQLAPLSLSDEAHAAALRLHLDSPAEALEAALDFVDAQGGARAYLLANGARPEHLAELARRATPADAAASATADSVANDSAADSAEATR